MLRLLLPLLLLSSLSLSAQPLAVPGTAVQISLTELPGGTVKLGRGDSTRTVRLSPFSIGTYEVTYEQYSAYLNDEALSQNSAADAVTRPSQPYIDFSLGMGKEGGYPAHSMQPAGAIMFCRWLYRKTGQFFRLPTEAEWEYAALGGTNGDAQTKTEGWYATNSGGRYHPVGALKPNGFGLHDMAGNVAEWTLDEYRPEYPMHFSEGALDPVVLPKTRYPRTVRGGHYAAETAGARVRQPNDPVWNRRDPQVPKSRWWNADAPFVGFRIVRPKQPPTPEEAEAFYRSLLGQ